MSNNYNPQSINCYEPADDAVKATPSCDIHPETQAFVEEIGAKKIRTTRFQAVILRLDAARRVH